MGILKLYLCDKEGWCIGSVRGCAGGECNHTANPNHSVTLKNNKKPKFEAHFYNKKMYWMEVEK